MPTVLSSCCSSSYEAWTCTWTWASLRRAIVLLTLGVVTLCYYLFSHFIHHIHFEPPHPHDGNSTHDNDDHDHQQHGRNGSFDNFHLKKDGLFLYGLALPLLLLTLASLIWNPSTAATTKPKRGDGDGDDNNAAAKEESPSPSSPSRGDIGVRKWTVICFVTPLFLVMLEGAWGHNNGVFRKAWSGGGWYDLYIGICMSLMSPSGYAATWSLALFLIPVTKHSPILDWLRVSPVRALAFHRVTGWTGFWNSLLHGFLHLRHLMDVLNPHRTRSRLQQLEFLIVPEDPWVCFATQNPWGVFFGRHQQQQQEPMGGSMEDAEAQQCWLALVNLTGVVSVAAFCLLAITSLPSVRRYSYSLFYCVHIPSAWIMLLTAIWHYPTCALVLIPNIIYYLSFNIPVYVAQKTDGWDDSWMRKKSERPKGGPLVEANLIRGGSIELVFATEPGDHPRHESRFVRLSCPGVSPLSHPFSVFSQQDLGVRAGGTADADNNNNNPSPPPPPSTVSVLLRSSGPFTERLTKALFAAESGNGRPTDNNNGEEEEEQLESSSSLARPLLIDQSTIPVVPPCEMRVDAFYAGSFDWVESALKSHDEILLVAGGVGIVPFLEFLPSLQQRIASTDSTTATAFLRSGGEDDGEDAPFVDGESNVPYGPSKIHLHWYCREIGLASYVWKKYLRRHTEDGWEGNPVCKGRLKIHLHLTSLDPGTAAAGTASEELLRNSDNDGLVAKQSYTNTVRPVRDAHFTRTTTPWWWSLRLLSPGIPMTMGIALHWWWYKEFVVADEFRHDNLVIRSHGIVFAIALATVAAFLVEVLLLLCRLRGRERGGAIAAARESPDSGLSSSRGETHTDLETAQTQTGTAGVRGREDTDAFTDTVLTVTGGRPSMDSVIRGFLRSSDRPGVYSCGPRPLMESLESAVRAGRGDNNNCAFYREDSEL